MKIYVKQVFKEGENTSHILLTSWVIQLSCIFVQAMPELTVESH